MAVLFAMMMFIVAIVPTGSVMAEGTLSGMDVSEAGMVDDQAIMILPKDKGTALNDTSQPEIQGETAPNVAKDDSVNGTPEMEPDQSGAHGSNRAETGGFVWQSQN